MEVKLLHDVVILVVLVILSPIVRSENCEDIFGSEDSFVCICKDTQCDTIGTVNLPEEGNYVVVTSTRDALRFDVKEKPISNDSSSSATASVFIDRTTPKQSIMGFGGAFTDAAGINIRTLKPALQETLLRHYFGAEGIEYTMARVPIAGCDFSSRPYTYDDVEGDSDLLYFNLTMEDHDYKIPYIKLAREISSKPLKLFASPWSPPAWMKTNGMLNGTGSLLPEYRQSWANYFIRFFEEYQKQGIDFWGFTTQNEPSMGLVNDHFWNACGYKPEDLRDFIKDYLGPTVDSTQFSDLIMMSVDDSRETFPIYPNTILSDSVANSYVDGVAIHWYADKIIPPSVIEAVHTNFSDKFYLYTEACHFPVALSSGAPVKLGSWTYGEQYVHDIIENLNHWASGWIDWNLVLDMNGGPNWRNNFVDSPVIVSVDGLEFYKQPMFYAIGHFSKFLPEDSVILTTTLTESSIHIRESVSAVAALRPDGHTTLVLLNKNRDPTIVDVKDSDGFNMSVTLPAKSFTTILL